MEWKGPPSLQSNHVYGYDILTRVVGDDRTMRGLGELKPNLLSQPYKIGYDELLPTFVVPPNLSDLVVHGSCRKPHGNSPGAGTDALAIVDELLQSSHAVPAQRPHFQIFTGDIVYSKNERPFCKQGRWRTGRI